MLFLNGIAFGEFRSFIACGMSEVCFSKGSANWCKQVNDNDDDEV